MVRRSIGSIRIMPGIRMINKSGILRRTMKNYRHTRGDVSGITTEALSTCVSMPSVSDTTYYVQT